MPKVLTATEKLKEGIPVFARMPWDDDVEPLSRELIQPRRKSGRHDIFELDGSKYTALKPSECPVDCIKCTDCPSTKGCIYYGKY